LALGYPFSTHTVSLIGFSLGSQVIKSTLKTLHRIGATDIIHNVHFLGGATHFEKLQKDWETIFSTVVGGRITNSYSFGDNVLYTYSAVEGHQSIGRNP
jgi:Protein of unknown function (DUF726)